MNQRERNTHQKSSLFSRANMVAVLGLIVFSHLGHVPASYGQLTVPVAEPIDPVTVGSKPVRVSISTRDLDAEWLALKTSGELLAPTKMYNRMLADLTAIRTAFPVVANIHAKPDWVLGEVVLSGIFPPPPNPDAKKMLKHALPRNLQHHNRICCNHDHIHQALQLRTARHAAQYLLRY